MRQKSVYGVTRFSLADPLTLIVGARYTDWHGSTWSSGLGSHSQDEDDITPYGGLVYDINDVWSTYLSYTEIFQPQSYRLAGGNGYLDPLVGKNYETGIKAAWFDGLLNASFSVFRLEQDNVADIVSTPGSLITTATPVSDVVSEGFEAELTGAVTDDLDMTVGITHYTATSAEGSFNTDRPRTQANLFASYRVPQWRQLTIGGGGQVAERYLHRRPGCARRRNPRLRAEQLCGRECLRSLPVHAAAGATGQREEPVRREVLQLFRHLRCLW